MSKYLTPTKQVLFVMFMFFSWHLTAQNKSGLQANLSGKIVNESQEEIVYASVVLLQNESTITNSTITDESGNFKITNIEPGVYSLRIDHNKFETYTTQPFTLADNESKIISNIQLKATANSLDEVVINHKKAMIEVKADKIVFNVSSSPSASGTNGLDLLKKSPGVTLGLDNSISVLGKSNVQIYLNGIPSQLVGSDLTTFLKSLSSDMIDSIEIISNPSSKYDAEGTGGIINIRLKKNVATGFNGNVNSSFTKGIEYKFSNNLSLNYGTEKIHANLDVTQSYDNNLEYFADEIQKQNNAVFYLNSRENNIQRGYNVGAGFDYQPNENHFLNLNVRTILTNNNNDLNSITDIYRDTPPEFSEILSSQSNGNGNSKNYFGSLNHLWNLNDSSILTSNLSLGNYNSNRSTYQPNTYYEPDGTTIIDTQNATFDADTQINLWSAKVDFDKDWKKMSFSTGIKYSHVLTKNQFAFYNLENNEPIFDPLKSNIFNYTEDVAAVYASANITLNTAMSLNLGLRVEHTYSNGQLLNDIDIDIENKNVTLTYTDFFPNLGFNYDTQNNHVFSINIGRRITRPNYQDLNPFETPVSQLVVWKGNPFLQPNYIMNYQVSYAFKQNLVITLAYSNTIDFFAKIVEITEGDKSQIIPRNMDNSNNYGISISYPLTITDYWQIIAFGNLSYQTFDGEIEQTIIDIETTLWDFQIQSIFNLSKGLLIDLTYTQRSDWIWRGSVDIEGNGGLSFGIRKYFFEEKLQLILTGSNIFGTQLDNPYSSDYGGIELNGIYRDDSQRFGLGATFKFGNPKVKENEKIESSLEDELNRIQN